MLLIGRDGDAARELDGAGHNTDGLMVINVRADGSSIDLMSIPRDVVDVPLADGRIWTGKINAIANSLGLSVLKDAVATMLAIPIDYYVELNMDGMAALVDAAGGVDVTLATPLDDPHLDLHLAAGQQHLDGATAMLYARSRMTTSDYARAERQQQLLLALRSRLLEGNFDPIAVFTSLPNLRHDVPDDEMAGLLDLARASRDTLGTGIVFDGSYSSFVGFAGERGWIQQLNFDAVRGYAAEVLAPTD